MPGGPELLLIQLTDLQFMSPYCNASLCCNMSLRCCILPYVGVLRRTTSVKSIVALCPSVLVFWIEDSVVQLASKLQDLCMSARG